MPLTPALETLFNAYVEAALWSSYDDHEQPMDKNFLPDDGKVYGTPSRSPEKGG